MAGGGRIQITDRDGRNQDATARVVNGRLLTSSLATPASPDGNLPVKFGDSPSIDAFDRLRVSNPVGLFESTQTYDTQTLVWNTDLVGGGTVTFLPNESASALTVAASGDSVVRQSKDYLRYQPGKSQLIFATFCFKAGDPNVRKRVGYFDTRNGIYLEEIDGTLAWVIRSYTSGAVVEERVAQANWNIDTFAGLDSTQAQILIIDLEWLGVGRVRVGFVIDGIIIYVHEFLHANVTSTVYMTSAQLPMRYEIEATGAFAGGNTLEQICCSVISEGGQEEAIGYPFATIRTSLVAIGGARVPIISLRPKLTFNGAINRVQVIQRQIETLFSGNNGIGYVEVIYNGTLTGAAFTSVSAQSVMERDVAATAIAGGEVVRSFYCASTSQARQTSETSILGRLPISLNIAGTVADTITICASLISGTLSGGGAFNWQEYR
jgi:hypothetical protein